MFLGQQSGCKVGWAFYSTEDEAKVRADRESVARERKFEQGYDFGYLWPGSYKKVNDREYGECWMVVTT